jgi:hypothetical protein
VRYLGIEVDDAIEIAEKIDIWPPFSGRARGLCLTRTASEAFAMVRRIRSEDHSKAVMGAAGSGEAVQHGQESANGINGRVLSQWSEPATSMLALRDKIGHKRL